MTRQCARPCCAHAAVATLAYDYRGQTVWLDRLAADPHPMTHDLCTAHADRFSAPKGWRLDDRRMVAPLKVPSPEGEREYRSQLAS